MKYSKGQKVTFKTVDCHGNRESTHYGTIIEIEPNKHVRHVYVVETDYGNIAKLTDEELD